MPRKKLSKADRHAREAQRRAASVTRLAAVHSGELAARVAVVMEQVREVRLDAIRRELAEAAERRRAQELLQAALNPASPFPWVPWGYELAEVPEPVIRPMVPQLRLVHSRNTIELPVITLGRRLAVAA